MVADNQDMPGHLVRRLQQAAVAIFHAEVGEAGYDVTPVQYAALSAVRANPGVDQVTLAGLIAHDRTTITGVVDRLAQKGFVTRNPGKTDRRVRTLHLTDEGSQALGGIEPAVESAQRIMLRGLSEAEAEDFMKLLRKALDAVNDLSRAPLRAGSTDAAKGKQQGR